MSKNILSQGYNGYHYAMIKYHKEQNNSTLIKLNIMSTLTNSKRKYTSKKKYTKEELAIIADCVKANPENISKACETAKLRIKKELKIERTLNGVSYQYHMKVKPNSKLFQIRGQKNLPANVKNIQTKKVITNTKKEIEVPTRKSYSPQYKIVMSMINTLSLEDKERLVMETYASL